MTWQLRVSLISVLLLQVYQGIIKAQSIDYIDCKVINQVNSEPVPFATIKLKYNQLGVYANAGGDFKIAGNPEFQDDSLLVTCIGYRQNSIAFRDLNKTGQNQISLDPIIYGLSEVKVTSSVRKLGSYSIIEKAIKNINLNYPQKPFSQITYYRDYQKLDGKYINLNEAMVQILDNGFSSESLTNKYRLLDFKKNNEFSRMNISPYYENKESMDPDNFDKRIPQARLGDQYGNELFVLMVHDAIRNFNARSFSFIDIFSHDFLLNHNFSPPEPVYNNNLMLFKIAFNGKSRIIGNLLLVNGAIYIQPRTFAIHKIEYSCSYNKEKKPEKMFSIDIEYGHEYSIDSLMHLRYISFNNYFSVQDKEDDTYFRIVDASIDKIHYINQTLIVEFNKNADPSSAANKSNYEILIGKQPLKINSIQVAGKRVFIRTKNENLKSKRDSCYINVHNVTDIDGNVLDKRKTVNLYQYRELFVQENNKPIHLKDSCFMKYMPLEENCRSSFEGSEKYWMNTPASLKSNE